MCQPYLVDVLRTAAQQNFAKIFIWPLFVLPGTHTERDIPDLVSQCAAEYPAATLQLLPYPGNDPSFHSWLSQAMAEVLPEQP
ncbi:MAG: hypothetical protein EOM23_10345 [Candidatus Moranbacteria bacterium]|nr:hypothetical protein [Candidatus Moranbacteria bacterium]